MLTRKLIVVVVLINCSISFAQTKYTISGYVKDVKTGEELIGANVFIKELIPATGASANAYGFYSITIPEGDYTITVQYIGYEPKSVHILLKQNTKQDFNLAESVTKLGEVVIAAEKKDENITKIQMGVEKLDVKEIRNIPLLLGEKDVFKMLQLRPGVKSAGEGNSGFYVRGGAADQNLILLDEATVYNASHLLGFFSVFNADALKDVTLYKGNQPSEYGGRLSSVLDIRMKEGNDKKYGLEGGIGLTATRLTIEGPIIKEKGSFTISGRRTYADLFLIFIKDSSINQNKLYFYDLNVKANYRINDRNRIFLSGYFGKDVFGMKNVFGFDWGNTTGTLRWNHLFSEKMFSNTSLIFSNYNYNINIEPAGAKVKIISRIQDYNIKQDFQFYINSKNKLKFGLNSIYHRIIPGAFTNETDSSISELNLKNNRDWENAAYISHELKPTAQFSIECGIRLSTFSVLGPGDFYTYNKIGETIDTASYGSGEFVKTYFNIEPRININYIINEKSSLKISFAKNTQNLHLLSNFTSGNPTDLWIPSSNHVKPEIANQISFGYFRNFQDNNYEFSTEIYYKHLQNQIEYKDGAKQFNIFGNGNELIFDENVESQLLFGIGRAYGIEFILRKKYGRFNGWAGYTLAKTEKKIEGINNGEYFPAKQDRTHDISIVGIYELSKKLTISATWVYYTGNAVTFPSGKYKVAGQIVYYYTERNGYRMPEYHRLDIGATWQRKKTEKFESSWSFSLYNAYGRKNAFSITFREDPDDPLKTQAVQTTLFRWIPSFTYNFKF
ncbi:MAG: TonB-dependent receptor [Bacteroidales bacterium]